MRGREEMDTSTWECQSGKRHQLNQHCDCHVIHFNKYRSNQIARRRADALKQLLKEADELISKDKWLDK